MRVKLLTEHDLEFLSLKVDCIGSSESTLVKMPHCWKLHVTAHLWKRYHRVFDPSYKVCITDVGVHAIDAIILKVVN